jgi:hypothetical protein
MKLKVWMKITDCGDGDVLVELYPSQEAALEGLDSNGFEIGDDSCEDIPCAIDYAYIDTDDWV